MHLVFWGVVITACALRVQLPALLVLSLESLLVPSSLKLSQVWTYVQFTVEFRLFRVQYFGFRASSSQLRSLDFRLLNLDFCLVVKYEIREWSLPIMVPTTRSYPKSETAFTTQMGFPRIRSLGFRV